jgi:hypothetical protein
MAIFPSMIRGVFSLTKPNIAEATLTVTMTVGEWKQVREQISDKWPGWTFAALIGNLIRHAEQSFQEQVESEAP